jgi:uncharacterized membrane protein
MKGLSKSGRSAATLICVVSTFGSAAGNGGQGSPSSDRQTTRYAIVDLGLIGRAPAQPYGMADNHLIAGGVITETGASHAVLWREGEPTDIGARGFGGVNSLATGPGSLSERLKQ